MNEPVADDDADWNRVLRYPLKAIRDREPTRTVLVGSNKWSQCSTFAALDVPDDRHLMLTFHFYNPMLITHYQASWVPVIAQYKGPIHYPGQPIADAEWAKLPEAMKSDLAEANKPFAVEDMEKQIALPLAVAKRTGLPLHCGEFGVVHHAPDAVRIAWYRDILAVFNRHGIAWSNWDYKGGFGLIDSAGNETAAKRGLIG
jgi:endoglucanase